MILIVETNFIAFFKCFFTNDDITGLGLYNILKLYAFIKGSKKSLHTVILCDAPLHQENKL